MERNQLYRTPILVLHVHIKETSLSWTVERTFNWGEGAEKRAPEL